MYPGTPDHADYKDSTVYKMVSFTFASICNLIDLATIKILRHSHHTAYRKAFKLETNMFLSNFNLTQHKLKVNMITPRGENSFEILHALPEEFVNSDQPRPTLIYLHGGGMVFGSAHKMTLKLASYMRAQVFGIEYRMAPEHPFPVPVTDSIDAIKFLLTVNNANFDKYKIGKFAVFGDSAGGHLVITTALGINYQEEFGVQPEVLVPIVPMTQMLRFDTPSYLDNYAIGSLPSVKNMLAFWLHFAGEDVYNRVNYEIMTRNLHWTQDLATNPENSEFIDRVDPEKWLSAEDIKLHESGRNKAWKALDRNKKFDHNDAIVKTKQNFANLIKNKLFCPGLAEDADLEFLLKNSPRIDMFIAGIDALHSEGQMLFNRLQHVKQLRNMETGLRLHNMKGAHHIFYSQDNLSSNDGFDHYNPHFLEIVESLSVIKK